MAVYVDNARHPLGRMLMCHMAADTEAELHAFARTLGLKREWYQNHKPSLAHYDICQTKRRRAIDMGAVEVSTKQMVKQMRARSQHDSKDKEGI